MLGSHDQAAPHEPEERLLSLILGPDPGIINDIHNAAKVGGVGKRGARGIGLLVGLLIGLLVLLLFTTH